MFTWVSIKNKTKRISEHVVQQHLLPVRTVQTLYLSAWGCAPGAHGSSLCGSRSERVSETDPYDNKRKVTRWINWAQTHGSGECMGAEQCRMYCVHWNTLKAKLARKSLADRRPATGRSWKPVFSIKWPNSRKCQTGSGAMTYSVSFNICLQMLDSHFLSPFRKADTSRSWGMRSSP